MRQKQTADRHAVSGAFVFLLLGMFALLCTVMVLLSARMYRTAVNKGEESSRRRILSGYAVQLAHAADRAGALRTETRDGIPMLVVRWDPADDEGYESCVYAWEGSLREYYRDPADDFDPDMGEVLCAAGTFVPELTDGLLHITADDTVLDIALHCWEEAAE